MLVHGARSAGQKLPASPALRQARARERDVRDDWNLIQNYFKEVDHQADQMQTVSL